MANTNAPFGFRPVIRSGGSPFSVTEYAKPATDTHTLYAFDFVKKVTGAVALPENASFNLPTVQSMTQGTPGTTLIVGASLTYGAASTLSVHPVTDELDVIYLAQAKTGVAVTTTGHVGKNANIDVSAGSATTKLSAMSVDSGTIDTTNTLDVRILRVAMLTSNAEGDSTILEVLVNKSALAEGSTGV